MNETKIKERIKIAQKCNQSIANVVGAGLASAHEKTTNNKLNANTVGVGALGDPLFEEQAKNSSKEPNYGRKVASASTKSRHPKPNSLYKGTLKFKL